MIRPGPLSRAAADELNRALDELRALRRLTGTPPISVQHTPAGTLIQLQQPTTPGTLEVRTLDGALIIPGVQTLVLDQADGYVLSQPTSGEARLDFTGSGGGSLTVAGSTGTPVLTGITEIRIGIPDGLNLTSVSAGIARIGTVDAGVSQRGVVGTGAQTFAGLKTFRDNATAGHAGSAGAQWGAITSEGNGSIRWVVSAGVLRSEWRVDSVSGIDAELTLGNLSSRPIANLTSSTTGSGTAAFAVQGNIGQDATIDLGSSGSTRLVFTGGLLTQVTTVP